ncbi:M20/M25/M40 family metallo-hydrolase [Bacillus massilinigeriensis]|uniref:M20/M25/M40 family metallo-hydrolase n=1 Tax=Bacillus mediterraneensis TaxID=1805474 RepID=UPI0008F7FB45|nr:M20/M25/M40 family metallo-hydrolase [Bacillus mediterraneensis]
MKKWKALLLAGALIMSGGFATGAKAAPQNHPGELAYKHVEVLTEGIGPRVAGSENEAKARAYIAAELNKLGMNSKVQPFQYTRKSVVKSSANIFALKDSKKTNKQIIVGTHYDSVKTGKGADDNASSVGVILETAKKLQHRTLPYDVKFIFFGAEEEGLQGSSFYVSQMNHNERKNTVAMINLDSLLAGDNIYVYGGEQDSWIRDLALSIAGKKKIPLETNPGLNPEYPAGTTGDWSDHAPFKKAGIPVAYLEATNWEIGDLDGYTQTVNHGAIWHTDNDNLSFLNKAFPGRPKERLYQFTTIMTELLTDMKHELR